MFPEFDEDTPAVQADQTVVACFTIRFPDRAIEVVYRADDERKCSRCGVTARPWIVVFPEMDKRGVFCSCCLHQDAKLPWARKPENERRRPQISAHLRREVFERDGGRCVYCNRSAADLERGEIMHADHVVPVSRGGETTLENLVTACSTCNIGKGARPRG